MIIFAVIVINNNNNNYILKLCIKLFKSDSKDIDNVTKGFYFK